MTVADIGATLSNASSLGANAALLLQAAEHRLQLASLEIEHAGARLRATALGAFAAGAAVILLGVTLNLTVAAVFWDGPWRVPALLILASAESALLASCAWFVVKGLRELRLFTDLRTQLGKDCSCLREILTHPN